MFNSFFGLAQERIALLKYISEENIHIEAKRDKKRETKNNIRETNIVLFSSFKVSREVNKS